MPITAAYTWAESETTVQLQVTLKGQAKSKVDVFATECYLKISFPPYLLELDLHGRIDAVQPKARTEKGILIFKAKKKEGHTGIWGKLGACVDRNKSEPEVRIRREESIKEQLKQEQELTERIALRKHEDERLALRSQMGVEEEERRRIEDIKAEEKAKAEEGVYQAFAELGAKQQRNGSAPPPVGVPQPKSTPPVASSSPLLGAPEGVKAERTLENIAEVLPAVQTIGANLSTIACAKIGGVLDRDTEASGDRNGENVAAIREEGKSSDPKDSTVREGSTDEGAPLEDETTREHELNGEEDLDSAVRHVPDPRTPIDVVPIGFTMRLFPTPLRESKVADETAWIMKNRRHLRKNATLVGRLPAGETGDRVDLPIDISESDPVWLKGKGDDFYRGGDFRAAINAYTAALDADPENRAPCLSNRAACHLRLGNAEECVADCGNALEILKSLPESGTSQAKALARRALAYREMGHYQLSLEDFQATQGFAPGDPVLVAEVAKAGSLAKLESAKKEAAARFASGDIDGACELYTAALAVVPEIPSCLSNRAACHLALGRPAECVRDCTLALELLSADLTVNSGDGSAAENLVAIHSDANVDSGYSTSTIGQMRNQPPAGSVPRIGSEKRRLWVLSTMTRRGRARVQLGCLEAALRDYRAASALAPGDKALEGDVNELTRRVQEAQVPLTH